MPEEKKVQASKKGTKEAQRKPPTKSAKKSYAIYIYKVVKQVPLLKGYEHRELTCYNKWQTTSCQDIQTAQGTGQARHVRGDKGSD